MRDVKYLFHSAAVALMLSCLAAAAQESEPEAGPPDSLRALAEMSLEDLANLEVSSVSKRSEKRTSAAAAVYVITAEDIRRSTALSLPDLLRMAPGIHVASLDATKRSVSSRGFSGRFANSLLVLIDGRSIYSPLFSGTEWEVQDMMLENIERIEIIRGPGGALWGANAVNGVINIVTKNAADTPGGLVSLGAGTEFPGFGGIRYGGSAGENGDYRLSLRLLLRDDGARYDGQRAEDNAEHVRGEARFDWDWGDTRATVLANLYGMEIGQVVESPSLLPPQSRLSRVDGYYSGGNLLGRWTRAYADGAELRLQAFYDHTETNPFALHEDRDTFDLELQYRMAPTGRHEFMWGAAFRYFDNRTAGNELTALDPPRQRKRLFSAFIQDRISMLDDRLVLTLGSKFEHNDFTGFEVQPSARLAWTPNDRHTLWAAVSRAVRTPSLLEEFGVIASMAFDNVLLSLVGDGDYGSEDLIALEMGYRVRPADTLQLDFALFYNTYNDLRTVEIGAPSLALTPLPPHLAIPAFARNNMDGHTYGMEVSVDWAPAPWWRLRVNYSLLEMDLHLEPSTIELVSGGTEDSSPEQQVFVGSYMDLGESVDLDVFLRYVDQLPALGIDDYLTADVRVAWQPRDDFEVEIVGHNLLQPEHVEFDSMFVNTVPTATQRGIYGKITWQF